MIFDLTKMALLPKKPLNGVNQPSQNCFQSYMQGNVINTRLSSQKKIRIGKPISIRYMIDSNASQIADLSIATRGSAPKKVDEIKQRNKRKSVCNYWRKIRAFVHVWAFIRYARVYSSMKKVRDFKISQASQSYQAATKRITEWILERTRNFFSEMINPNLSHVDLRKNLNTNEKSNYMKYYMKVFFDQLFQNVSKPADIPDEIRGIFAKFILTSVYFPKKYLTSFEINRLNFNLNGSLAKVKDSSASMIIGLLVFSRIICQKILLKITSHFPVVSEIEYLKDNFKQFASIIHYTAIYIYKAKTSISRNAIPLLNYYRNYKEKPKFDTYDQFSNLIQFESLPQDHDQLAIGLFPYEESASFINFNKEWNQQIKGLIYEWSLALSYHVMNK
jgi:hypothetical protein